ncbi:DUF2849 domain-containing protein [Pseudoruegeria sp. SK021]|uniref:DUF2849 domain-containing protein n=1 Tax=Pseudoruegeria sp. SK021 TaxID=1933035 RepID=UPI000A24CDD1|nr:DUF2849 domain-containing protein [Pseudoruegeria sp. SK021]OSP56329.1 sulfite reductase [Pseudoruegeria sp. SK021]
MSRKFTPKIVTANALRDGDVIYLTEDDGWSPDIAKAELIDDEAHAEIRLIFASQQTGEVVGAYLADAVADTNGPKPVHFREVFRSRGPSNYAHGKQTVQQDRA